MNAEIKILQERESKLRAELNETRTALSNALIAQAGEIYGVYIGDVVRDRGKEYRVIKIKPNYGYKPWLVGNLKKKDGTFGTAKRNLFSSWVKVL
jgi:hypothetical protein